MNAEDAKAFDDAHAELVALHASETVVTVAEEFIRGELTALEFLGRLASLPEVRAALDGLAAISGTAAGVAAGPLAPIVGPAAGALALLALHAAESKIATLAPPSSPS